jgi:hypothetical protein
MILVVLLSAPLAILTGPLEARAAVLNGLREIKEGVTAAYLSWCSGCGDPNRKFRWVFEKPEAYWAPKTIEFGGKSYDFTLKPQPSPALPTVNSEEAHVEAVSDPSDALRVRMSVTPRRDLRRGDTKYYINFGDDPAITGDTNKMIAVGSAALMEHVFPRRGQYKIEVTVAEKMSESQREKYPEQPPSEGDMWAIKDIITINLLVGE